MSVIVGEGGSGGAIAIATTNKVLMLEHSVYSVISPEGCASILWKDTKYAEEAAASMKITLNYNCFISNKFEIKSNSKNLV